MSNPHLIIDREGHVVTLTLNRPEARNAFSPEMYCRLADAWEMIDADPEVRVAILTGAGGHFSSGADLKAMFAPTDDEWTRRVKADQDIAWRAFLRHYRLKKPLIAAVEGTALAGGTEILQATDIRVAARGAKFGVTEAGWGLFPLGGSTVRLRRQIPYTIAMDMLLTARRISADEALSYGLIGRVVPDGEALAEAKKIAEQIAGNGPLAVQAIKRSVQETEGLPEREALARELEIGWPILSTEDVKEGTRAFAEKRKPAFKGKLIALVLLAGLPRVAGLRPRRAAAQPRDARPSPAVVAALAAILRVARQIRAAAVGAGHVVGRADALTRDARPAAAGDPALAAVLGVARQVGARPLAGHGAGRTRAALTRRAALAAQA